MLTSGACTPSCAAACEGEVLHDSVCARVIWPGALRERINRLIPGISRRPHLPHKVTSNRFCSVHFKVISIELKVWARKIATLLKLNETGGQGRRAIPNDNTRAGNQRGGGGEVHRCGGNEGGREGESDGGR